MEGDLISILRYHKVSGITKHPVTMARFSISPDGGCFDGINDDDLLLFPLAQKLLMKEFFDN